MNERPIIIATRGSALALAQSNHVLETCRKAFPQYSFALSILKTTGDKLQTAAPSKLKEPLPKGLFTKELEVAMLKGEADLAVHSLKDLPVELPAGLTLGAVGKRADVRDVFIYRDAASTPADRRGFAPGLGLKALPGGLTVATSSTRRQLQIQSLRPDYQVVEIRGNVATRMQKLADRPELDATVLAAAGLQRLHFTIGPDSRLSGEGIPAGLVATVLPVDEMLPAVGQGAIGIETRADDPRIQAICEQLNHPETAWAAHAERALLRALGGGCQSPLGAHAELVEGGLRLRAVLYENGHCLTAERTGSREEPEALGVAVAAALRAG